MDSKTEPAKRSFKLMDNEKERNRIIEDADKYGFSVPYDGTSEFYDRSAIKAYIAGATAEYNRAQEEITRLKAELERERELRNGKLSEIRTYHQTLIARFYNNNSFDKESLSKIIDELEIMLK